MKCAAIWLLAAGAAGATSTMEPAWAGDLQPPCAARSAQQLVCSADTCVRLDTLRICDAAASPAPRQAAAPMPVRRIGLEERSHRQLEQLIASIN